MGDLRLPLTDKNVAGLPLALGQQYLARDTELAGFFVLVGIRTKSFMIQADLRTKGARQSIRMKIGESGELSARDARAKAKGLLAAIAAGADPRANKKAQAQPKIGEVPTLRQAWSRYMESHLRRRGRAQSTIAHYTDHVERLLADWLDRPMSELGEEPRLVADRHEMITEVNGPQIASELYVSLNTIRTHTKHIFDKLDVNSRAAAVRRARELGIL